MLRRVTYVALAPWTLVMAARDIGIGLRALTAAGGPLDRIADVSASLERLAALDESLRQLGNLEETLQQLTASVATLPELPERVRAIEGLVGNLQPSLDQLETAIADLQRTIGTLGQSLVPIGRLAGRVPGGRARG
jgi:prefoldin subunit 5